MPLVPYCVYILPESRWKSSGWGGFFGFFYGGKTGEKGVLGSQEKTATNCVSDKGIGAGAGPLPSPVYRLFGLVAVGP